MILLFSGKDQVTVGVVALDDNEVSFHAKCKGSYAPLYSKLQGEKVSLNLILTSILVHFLSYLGGGR